MTIENRDDIKILEENEKHNPDSFEKATTLDLEILKKKSWGEKHADTIKKSIEGIFNKKEKTEEKDIDPEEHLSQKASQIGAHIEELDKNEDWQTLTNGQKMLALEQMSQNTLLNVKNIGEERFKESLQGLGFIKKGLKNLRKSHWISKEEKQVLEEVRRGEIAPDKESGEVILKHLKELNLETILDSQGKTTIEFTKTPPNCSEILATEIKNYNQIANEFSKIPARFGDPTLASKAELKKYKDLEYKFKHAQNNIIEEENKVEGEFRTLDHRAQEEFKIRALQSKIESPDAFKALDSIETELGIQRFFNNENALKLGYAGAGFVLRTGIKGTVGLAAAPIVGAAIGLWKGINNGNKKIKEAYKENKSGETRKERMERLKEETETLENKLRDEFAKPKNDQNKEMIGSLVAEIEGIKNKDKIDAVIDGQDSIKRLDHLVSKFEKETNGEKRLAAYSEVLRRINFIESKNERGLINFGDKNALALKYDLFKKIAEATVALENGFSFGITEDDVFNNDIKTHNEHIDKLLDRSLKNEKKFKDKRSKIKNKEIKKAVIMGATFATLGAGLKHFYEYVDGGDMVSGGLAKLKGIFGIDDTTSVRTENEAFTETITNKKVGWSQEKPEWLEEPERPEYNPKLRSDEEVEIEVKNNLLKSLSVIRKGEGATFPIARQIEELIKDPEHAKELGFTEGKDAHKFAIKKAAELAKVAGIIQADGTQILNKASAIGHTSYEVKIVDGEVSVNESFDGEDMSESTTDTEYEYAQKMPKHVVTPKETIISQDIKNPLQNISKERPDFKFLQDENNTEWQAEKEPTVDGETKLAQDIISDKKSHLGQELKKYHDYVKTETGKDIEVKSDDTAETYKKTLDEALESSGKTIPKEIIIEVPKAEVIIQKTGELTGNEKLIELNTLQQRTFEHFDKNLESFKNISKIDTKELEKLLTPSNEKNQIIILEGTSSDLSTARTLVESDYTSNAFILKSTPENFKITRGVGGIIKTEVTGSVSPNTETKILKELLYQDEKGIYHTYNIIEIEKPHQFAPEEIKVPLTNNQELNLKRVEVAPDAEPAIKAPTVPTQNPTEEIDEEINPYRVDPQKETLGDIENYTKYIDKNLEAKGFIRETHDYETEKTLQYILGDKNKMDFIRHSGRVWETIENEVSAKEMRDGFSVSNKNIDIDIDEERLALIASLEKAMKLESTGYFTNKDFSSVDIKKYISELKSYDATYQEEVTPRRFEKFQELGKKLFGTNGTLVLESTKRNEMLNIEKALKLRGDDNAEPDNVQNIEGYIKYAMNRISGDKKEELWANLSGKAQAQNGVLASR